MLNLFAYEYKQESYDSENGEKKMTKANNRKQAHRKMQSSMASSRVWVAHSTRSPRATPSYGRRVALPARPSSSVDCGTLRLLT